MHDEKAPTAERRAAEGPAEGGFALQRILVPLDFSGHAMKALGYARGLARRFGATLILLHVVEPLVYPSDLGYTPVVTDDLAADLQREAKTRLDATVAEVTSMGLQAEGILRSGRPYLEITGAAETSRADLIVITTHGYTGLKHVLLGSTAERVVRYARCPVLVVRDTEREDTGSAPQEVTGG